MSATTWRIPAYGNRSAQETHDYEEVRLFRAAIATAQNRTYQSTLGGKNKKTEGEKPVVRQARRAL